MKKLKAQADRLKPKEYIKKAREYAQELYGKDPGKFDKIESNWLGVRVIVYFRKSRFFLTYDLVMVYMKKDGELDSISKI